MPMSFEIDQTANLIRTTAWGTLTDDEVLHHKDALLRDPLYQPGMQELSDVREIKDLAVTPEGVKQMVAKDRADAGQTAGHRLAIVASEDLVYGMARMYELSSDGLPPSVGVFRSIADAEAWLATPEQ